ncbi:MAG: DoxX family protein [Chloroflexi bacterium]|nr:MAG: DoxX family protein [Chloroflexota bacterium]
MQATWQSWALTAVRVVMGAFFLMEAEHQLASGYIGGDDLAVKLQKAADDTAIPGYSFLIEHVFLKVDDPLTVLVIIGELAVGTALVIGLFTRLTAAVALFMNANFLLMNGLSFGGLIDALFISGELLLIVFAARQALSVDQLLARRGISGPLMSGSVAGSAAG